MRHRFVLVSVSVLTLGTLSGGVVGLRAAAGPSAARSPSAAAAPVTPRQFLDRYCIRCHNERRKATFANLALDSVDVQALGAKAGLWEKVIKKLRVRAMPPVNLPRPPAEEYDVVIAALERASIGRRRRRRIRGARRSIASTACSTPTPSAICSASRSMARRCCRPMTPAMGSTPLATC